MLRRSWVQRCSNPFPIIGRVLPRMTFPGIIRLLEEVLKCSDDPPKDAVETFRDLIGFAVLPLGPAVDKFCLLDHFPTPVLVVTQQKEVVLLDTTTTVQSVPSVHLNTFYKTSNVFPVQDMLKRI